MNCAYGIACGVAGIAGVFTGKQLLKYYQKDILNDHDHHGFVGKFLVDIKTRKITSGKIEYRPLYGPDRLPQKVLVSGLCCATCGVITSPREPIYPEGRNNNDHPQLTHVVPWVYIQ
jgi:hypothetical protein